MQNVIAHAAEGLTVSPPKKEPSQLRTSRNFHVKLAGLLEGVLDDTSGIEPGREGNGDTAWVRIPDSAPIRNLGPTVLEVKQLPHGLVTVRMEGAAASLFTGPLDEVREIILALCEQVNWNAIADMEVYSGIRPLD